MRGGVRGEAGGNRVSYADYLHCEECDVKLVYIGDRFDQEFDDVIVFCRRCWEEARHG